MNSSRIDRLWSPAHRKQVWPGLLSGAAAGAAGTTALNVITYLDIALRGRPTSSTPGKDGRGHGEVVRRHGSRKW